MINLKKWNSGLLLLTLMVSATMIACKSNNNQREKIDILKKQSDQEDRLKWFKDAKFGMVIHWGPYSQLAGEWNGHKEPAWIMVSPKKANNHDRFLTVFQIVDGDTKPLPVNYYETPVSYVVTLADRVVSMSNSADFVSKGFTLKIPAGNKYQVAMTGMKPGYWNVKSKNGKINFNTNVTARKNTIFFQGSSGEYIVTPVVGISPN